MEEYQSRKILHTRPYGIWARTVEKIIWRYYRLLRLPRQLHSEDRFKECLPYNYSSYGVIRTSLGGRLSFAFQETTSKSCCGTCHSQLELIEPRWHFSRNRYTSLFNNNCWQHFASSDFWSPSSVSSAI